jgi:hypothetical protein
MVDTNSEQNTQSNTELAAIMKHLGQLGDRLSAIESQLTQQTAMLDRLTQVEQNQMLNADRFRYGQLQRLLEASNWFEADKETIRVIQDIAEQDDLEELTPDDIQKFPCNALRVIDYLWSSYSGGKFGFGVQLQIYLELGGTLDTMIEKNQTLVEKLGDRVGWRENNRWRKCDELDYSLNAPVGCHPSRWWNSPYGSKMTNFFLARLLACELHDRH